MRKGTASPEKNSGKKLTIPARVRTPVEAFKMLELGQNVDVVAGYYDKLGVLSKDFAMMDHIEKLEALNQYREIVNKNKDVLDSEVNRRRKEIQDSIDKKKEEEIEKKILERLKNQKDDRTGDNKEVPK